MKENKKIDVSSVYYVTLLNKKLNKQKYAICRLKLGVFTNIKTDKKYYINNISGITPYSSIVKNYFGKKTVGELLKKDLLIDKSYNEEMNEYIYTDLEEYQKTLAIIKPDGIKNITKIIEMMYKNGLSINKYEVRLLDEEILRDHYSHLVDKQFYPKLKEYMMSSEVVIMVLEGANAVNKLRQLMGPTDSTKAPKGTIRGEFGTDLTYNAIHGSDSIENAEIEINRFFKQKQKRI